MDGISEYPSLDPENLEKIVRIGGELLLKKLIVIFLERVPSQIELLLEQQIQKNWKEVEYIAHSMKSSAGNLGAKKLFFYTQELETEAKNQNIPKINDWIQEIQNEYPVLQKKLEQILKREE